MATITLKGNPIHTVGDLPAKGSTAPDFTLTNGKLEDVTLASLGRQKKVLNIVPSLDTSVCALSAKHFDKAVASLPDTVVLTISADLPFAQGRFCKAEGLERVLTLSNFRSPAFGKAYGVQIVDGALSGLLSRAIVVLDASNKVVYTQQVPEIATEPDYNSALQAVQRG